MSASCGKPIDDGNRIVGGKEVDPFSIPWQVYVLLIDYGGGDHVACGGTLISPYHVLTAAHCAYCK